ncbi:hypothetical protein [Nocardioides daeguensis]|uniref:Oxidoreductase n=1 Tax=Nocardioides daeguensis TaxID=908359 RepID=A0ABP6VV10_9ACTN|nr:hypothetical protein [Nocardioides daeguensis]MBV6729738.1 hypothetical protein [Nocardioides daeguensis]MCR1772449.1 hypothetical protein [Nocardioides daeguensis]
MSKRVVLVGLGATGVAMARSFMERNDLRVVGAADRNPQAVGSDLGDVLGVEPLGVVVVDDPEKLPEAELAVVATTSDLNQVAATVLPLVAAGYNVMSICEELSFPWVSHAEVSRQIDDAAKASGVTVLGTGANPGVLMDTLPLLLTVLTQDAKRITIRRRTNMSRYGAILRKFGLGLTPDVFETAQAAGEVVGHYGFEQAIGAVASGLGWELDAIEVDDVTPVLLAQDLRTGAHLSIAPGQIAAVAHAARGLVDGKAVIDLEIVFGFFADGDTVQAGDDYRIEGEEQVLELSSSVGFESFLSTIAAAVNTAAAVVDARPGLLSMGDLPVRELASKGSRLTGVQR